MGQEPAGGGRCRLPVKGVEAEYAATELRGAERAAAPGMLAPPFTDAGKAIGGPAFRLDPAP